MSGLISKMNISMQNGYESYNTLKNFILNSMNDHTNSYNSEYTPCFTPKEMLDLLYNSSEYKDFVINSLVFKKLYNKFTALKLITVIVIAVALILIFSLFRLVSIGILLSIVFAFIILLKFKCKKSYQQYYNETMAKIINLAVNEYTITEKNQKNIINNNLINQILNINYHNYSTTYNYKFESKYEVGDDFELELRNTVQSKDNQGNTVTNDEIVFNGFSIVSENKHPHKILNGSIIKIREDLNIVSALLEDTVNSMVKSKRDFSFNSEKLNKHLDCTLTRTSFTSDVDQKMFEVTKIITPSFEERLLFLDERYNAFNMNISDTEFSFAVSMEKGTYQKLQSCELFKFTTSYKDKKFNINIFSDANFEYSKLYPILERLFLHKYFRFIYNYYMDSTRFNDYENKKISQYENEIKDIMNMPWKEFSQINGDYVKNLKEEIKEKYNNLLHPKD